jgi:hypothetical protein
VGMVTKYAGGVVKGFALIAGIIVTGVVQWILDGKPLKSLDYIAIVLVSVATFLHSQYPPKSKLSTNSTTETKTKSNKSDTNSSKCPFATNSSVSVTDGINYHGHGIVNKLNSLNSNNTKEVSMNTLSDGPNKDVLAQ